MNMNMNMNNNSAFGARTYQAPACQAPAEELMNDEYKLTQQLLADAGIGFDLNIMTALYEAGQVFLSARCADLSLDSIVPPSSPLRKRFQWNKELWLPPTGNAEIQFNAVFTGMFLVRIKRSPGSGFRVDGDEYAFTKVAPSIPAAASGRVSGTELCFGSKPETSNQKIQSAGIFRLEMTEEGWEIVPHAVYTPQQAASTSASSQERLWLFAMDAASNRGDENQKEENTKHANNVRAWWLERLVRMYKSAGIAFEEHALVSFVSLGGQANEMDGDKKQSTVLNVFNGAFAFGITPIARNLSAGVKDVNVEAVRKLKASMKHARKTGIEICAFPSGRVTPADMTSLELGDTRNSAVVSQAKAKPSASVYAPAHKVNGYGIPVLTPSGDSRRIGAELKATAFLPDGSMSLGIIYGATARAFHIFAGNKDRGYCKVAGDAMKEHRNMRRTVKGKDILTAANNSIGKFAAVVSGEGIKTRLELEKLFATIIATAVELDDSFATSLSDVAKYKLLCEEAYDIATGSTKTASKKTAVAGFAATAVRTPATAPAASSNTATEPKASTGDIMRDMLASNEEIAKAVKPFDAIFAGAGQAQAAKKASPLDVLNSTSVSSPQAPASASTVPTKENYFDLGAKATPGVTETEVTVPVPNPSAKKSSKSVDAAKVAQDKEDFWADLPQ
jgi:hypothetical protein